MNKFPLLEIHAKTVGLNIDHWTDIIALEFGSHCNIANDERTWYKWIVPSKLQLKNRFGLNGEIVILLHFPICGLNVNVTGLDNCASLIEWAVFKEQFRIYPVSVPIIKSSGKGSDHELHVIPRQAVPDCGFNNRGIHFVLSVILIND